MTSVAIAACAPIPARSTIRAYRAVVTKVPSWKWMERASRKICVEMGSIARPARHRAPAEVKTGHPLHDHPAIRIGRVSRGEPPHEIRSRRCSQRSGQQLFTARPSTSTTTTEDSCALATIEGSDADAATG